MTVSEVTIFHRKFEKSCCVECILLTLKELLDVALCRPADLGEGPK